MVSCLITAFVVFCIGGSRGKVCFVFHIAHLRCEECYMKTHIAQEINIAQFYMKTHIAQEVNMAQFHMKTHSTESQYRTVGNGHSNNCKQNP